MGRVFAFLVGGLSVVLFAASFLLAMGFFYSLLDPTAPVGACSASADCVGVLEPCPYGCLRTKFGCCTCQTPSHE